MVNSGAIMSASILLYLLKADMNMAQKYDYVFDFFKVNKNNMLTNWPRFDQGFFYLCIATSG